LSRSYAVLPLSERPFEAAVTVPGSKSITNRALICAALARGRSRLEGAGFSDDSRHMAESLRRLGVGVAEDPAGRAMTVEGLGAPPRIAAEAAAPPRVFVGNAGTAARFLPCLVAAGSGSVLFDSDPRMRERPMGALIKVLERQGAGFSPADGAVAPAGAAADRYPFLLKAAGLKGGDVAVDLNDSSQFASGLLLAAPYAASEVRLSAQGDRGQLPYVDMTAAVMEDFGVTVDAAPGRWRVPAGRPYQAQAAYRVEPDLSGAAYFFAAAALVPGRITVRGVSNASIQGDLRFLKVLQHLGLGFYQDEDGLTAEWHRTPEATLKGGITVDMNAFSDQALTLAALAPFADAPVKITNVAHIRRQECDRIMAIAANLGGLGVDVAEEPDGVEIRPWPAARRRGGVIKTFGDHRVAMAFSLLGLKVPGIVIDDADCVGKTFGDFWDVMDGLRRAQGDGA
jgi:3-phosphoshikimate 1-carboxyvinyltransferase